MRQTLLALAIAMSLSAAPAPGAQEEALAKQQPERVVAAKVNDVPVYVDEVQAALVKALRGRRISRQALPSLQAQALEQIIRQRLIDEFLQQEKIEVSQLELAMAVERMKKQLADKQQELADYLAAQRMTEADLDEQLGRQMRWQKYLEERITDERMQEYFQKHHKHYDGSQVRVRHILFRVGTGPDTLNAFTAQETAAQVRQQILDEELTFEAAAEKYSAGPSRRQGGDLGFIPRHGVMEEPFAQAAFSLQENEISPPTSTTFGVHLIQATEIKPGEGSWEDVKDQLRSALARETFQQVSTQARKSAEIEYTGKLPHLDRETGKLIPAEQGAATDTPDSP